MNPLTAKSPDGQRPGEGPAAVRAFLQIVPSARFVCVHRACLSVVSAAVAAHPWGLDRPAMARFAARYPGNSVAAMASYWVFVTERLLAFEAACPRSAIRARYEDALAEGPGLSSIRATLDVEERGGRGPWPEMSEPAGADRQDQPLQVPVDMIPEELRPRIDGLHAELGYPASLHGGDP